MAIESVEAVALERPNRLVVEGVAKTVEAVAVAGEPLRRSLAPNAVLVVDPAREKPVDREEIGVDLGLCMKRRYGSLGESPHVHLQRRVHAQPLIERAHREQQLV